MRRSPVSTLLCSPVLLKDFTQQSLPLNFSRILTASLDNVLVGFQPFALTTHFRLDAARNRRSWYSLA